MLGGVTASQNDFLSLVTAEGIALPGGPARPIATPNNVGNAVIANSFADPSAVLAVQENILAGSAVENVANGDLVTSDNDLTASATVINQVASQSIANGEDSLAVAVLDTTVDNTTSTARIDAVTVGTRIDNDGALTGDTSVTIDSNTVVSTARANDSTSALVANGANSGAAGNVASSPNNDDVYPAPGPLVLTGDLLATGVQAVDQQSNITATVTEAGLGLIDSNGAASVTAITGGVAVSNNRVAAVADGSRLNLQLSDALSGSDVDSTAYALQTFNDTNVAATADEISVGTNVDTITDTGVTVAGNAVQSAATANRATTTVDARPDQAADSVVVDVEQFVRAQNEDVSIAAETEDVLIGRTGETTSGVNTDVAGNRLTAIGIGNDQTTTVDLGQGSQLGEARVEGNQTLVLDGSNLTISGTLRESLIGTQTDDEDTDSRTTISGNTAIGQAIGNNASQALGDYAGVRESALTVSQTQTATGTAANLLTLDASVTELGVGADTDGRLEGPQLTVADNQIASLVTLNRNNQALGIQSGRSTGILDVGAGQTADGVIAAAALLDTRVGIVNAETRITESAARAVAEITLTGNTLDAQAELNRSLQSLAGVTGTQNGVIALITDQTATDAGGGISDVSATLDRTSIGLFETSLPIDVVDGRFDLVVSDNALAAQGNANLAQSLLGPVSGTVNTAGRLGLSIGQSSDNTSVLAQTLDTGLGISEANVGIGGGLFLGTTNNVAVNVTRNSLQALARQNSASASLGVVSGQLDGGDLRALIGQGTFGAGSTRASNSGVFAGITPAVGADPLDFGIAGASSSLVVSSNTVRADAADNLATVVGAGINGTIGAAAQAGASISQSSEGALIEALNSIILLGATQQNDGDVGAGAGGVDISVTDNTVVTVGSANNSSAALGGVAGGIDAGGSAGIDTTQFLDSQVTASTGQVDVGVTDANLGNASGAASLSISGNGVVTAANGNDSRADLGTSAARIDGTLGATSSQTVSDTSSLSADANAIRIGAIGIGEFATNEPVSLTVDRNQVNTSATANNSVATGAVSGSLSGTIDLSATQTLNGSADGIRATSGVDVAPIVIGLEGDTLGGNGSVSVANNGVTSAVAGNRVLNNLSDASFSTATGTIDLSATQTINGSAAALVAGVPDLLSSVDSTTIGVIGGDTTLPGVAISGNRLVADTVGNQSNRTLNGLSGNFDAATQTVALADTQSTNNAVLVAAVSSSQIGAILTTDLPVTSALTVNGNQVVAQSIANSSNQVVSLNGVSTRGGPLTSLNASQNLINTTVTASISDVSVGLLHGNAGANATFSGTAVTAGNALSATAIGNQASLVRNGR